MPEHDDVAEKVSHPGNFRVDFSAAAVNNEYHGSSTRFPWMNGGLGARTTSFIIQGINPNAR